MSVRLSVCLPSMKARIFICLDTYFSFSICSKITSKFKQRLLQLKVDQTSCNSGPTAGSRNVFLVGLFEINDRNTVVRLCEYCAFQTANFI